MKMKPRQQLWLREYMITFNATEAAKRAGYSEKTAYRAGYVNMQKFEAEIKKAMTEMESKLIASAEEVLQFLTASMRGEIQEDAVTQEGIVSKQISAKDRLKAAELLGKRHMLFTEKLHLEGEVKTVVVFEGENDIRD